MKPEGTSPSDAPVETPVQEKPKQKLNLNVDLRIVVLVLLLVIAGIVMLWKPWDSAPAADARTVSVSGEATITAAPDQYVFTPSYQFKNMDKTAALKELTAKSDEVVAKLKTLGVASGKIKSDSSGYENGMYYYDYDQTNKNYTYTLSLTVTVDNEKLAQKVQDYLVTTTPSGSVSPQASFSAAKQKELEAQARDEATKEARAKADQSAKNLGFKVGKIKSITDGSLGGVYPYAVQGMAVDDSTKSSAPELAVQPGENNLNYSVSVVYYIR